MNRDGVGKRDLIEFTEIVNHLALIKADGDLLFDGINLRNLADVTVEHALVVVVQRVMRDADLLRNLVGGLEPDAVDVLSQCQVGAILQSGSILSASPVRWQPIR